MAYRKEATGVVCAVAAAMFLSACWNADKWNVSIRDAIGSTSSEVISKVDYTPTQTWFALLPFTASGSEFSFSGGALYSKGKALTGSLIVETSRLTKGRDWSYLWEIPATWPKVTGVPSSTPTETAKSAKLTFASWLTKMVLVWERYAYEEKNLRPGDDYRFKIFKTSDEYYVLEFENKTESRVRDRKMENFESRVDKINDEYAGNPKKINDEIEKLRLEYWIDVRKFQ